VLDGGLEATARLIRRGPAALPSAVEVTLRAAPHARELVLDPHALRFTLLVEPRPGTKSVVKRNGPPKEGDRKGVTRGHESLALDRPVTLRLDLPERWESHVRLEGPARVAVLLATERWHRRDLRAAEEVRALSRAGGRQAWRGVLRSPWLDVEFPPLAEQAPARPSRER